jgi:excinuclease ABC subunit C
MTFLTPQQCSQLPEMPGIYLFYNLDRELVYVGKATSLKSRVRSYFSGRRTPRPIEEMIHEVAGIDFRPTDSVLEAVILESVYIKKFQPKYNVLGKDDKSWNYIVITKEEYPHIKTFREHELLQLTEREQRSHYQEIFGPYPGLNTKAALKILRHLFHFSSCEPHQGRPCLYRQMGQCLGVCTDEISSSEYRKQVIQPLILFLKGNKKQMLKEFEQQMKRAVHEEHFEKAARIRDQLKSLYRIQDIALMNESFFTDHKRVRQEENFRIEGYDISNLGATDKVGSMVVFDKHGPIKSAYRKFTIKTVEGQSDIDCLGEVLERRLNHTEWPLPKLFLIDGGRPQVTKARAVVQSRGSSIPVIGIAKGPERKRNDIILGNNDPQTITWVSEHKILLIKVRDEAHRFAITFNRSKRKLRK